MGTRLSPIRLIQHTMDNMMKNKLDKMVHKLFNNAELIKKNCAKNAVVLMLKHYRNV